MQILIFSCVGAGEVPADEEKAVWWRYMKKIHREKEIKFLKYRLTIHACEAKIPRQGLRLHRKNIENETTDLLPL